MGNLITFTIMFLNMQTYEELLLLSRKGDSFCGRQLDERIHQKRNAYMNAALVDIPYSFSKTDKDYIFETCFADAVANYCFQLRCSFLNYFISQMHYALQNLFKTRREYIMSISTPSFIPTEKLLNDSCQRDENDLMSTLFTWRKDIEMLAETSGMFSPREIRIARSHLENVTFKDIARIENCSISTAKKAWKKFLDYARDILGIDAAGNPK